MWIYSCGKGGYILSELANNLSRKHKVAYLYIDIQALPNNLTGFTYTPIAKIKT